ncbi:hypothetical protein DMP23_07610 [Amycolatopsis sp. A1MSW2902]
MTGLGREPRAEQPFGLRPQPRAQLRIPARRHRLLHLRGGAAMRTEVLAAAQARRSDRGHDRSSRLILPQHDPSGRRTQHPRTGPSRRERVDRRAGVDHNRLR